MLELSEISESSEEHALRLLSYTSRCVQDDCDCQPQSDWGWEVRSIDHHSMVDNGIGQWHHHQGRPAPQERLSHSAMVLNSRMAELLRNPYMFKSRR